MNIYIYIYIYILAKHMVNPEKGFVCAKPLSSREMDVRAII